MKEQKKRVSYSLPISTIELIEKLSKQYSKENKTFISKSNIVEYSIKQLECK
jgi:hypothetical protein